MLTRSICTRNLLLLLVYVIRKGVRCLCLGTTTFIYFFVFLVFLSKHCVYLSCLRNAIVEICFRSLLILFYYILKKKMINVFVIFDIKVNLEYETYRLYFFLLCRGVNFLFFLLLEESKIMFQIHLINKRKNNMKQNKLCLD